MRFQGWFLTLAVMVTALSLSGTACEYGERETGERDAGKTTVVQKPKITEEQATAAATKAVPGSVQSVRLETKGGNPIYEVTIQPQSPGAATQTPGAAKQTPGTVVNVQVDANTGNVLKTESAGERDGDDDD